jgi:AmiR/NasT family two-component response regulator
MRLDDQIIGALNLYSYEPRKWSDGDIAVAGVLADVATSYVVNASKLRQQEQLSEQLQEALESRVVIEQAKGITAHKNVVTIDQAYQLMRRHARDNNASLRVVAEAIVAVGLQV